MLANSLKNSGTSLWIGFPLFCYINHIWMPKGTFHEKKFTKNSEYFLSTHPDMDADTAHEGNTKNVSEKIDSCRNVCRIESCNSSFLKIVTNVCRIFVCFQ